MRFDNKFTVAILAAGMLLGFAAPAAAQPSQAQNNAQVGTDAQVSAESQGIFQALERIQAQLKSIQQRVTALEQQVNNSNEASVEAEADSEAEMESQSNRRGPPEQANANGKAEARGSNGAGAEVSAAAKSGDKQGIMAAISAFLSDRGNDRAAEAVDSPQTAPEDRNDSETPERDEGDLEINVTGDIETGNNVTLKASSEGEVVANASVKVNGDVVGQTDSNGEIVVEVPEADEFEVEIEYENGERELEGEVEYELETDSDSEAETESETEADVEINSSNASADLEVDSETSTALE